MDNKLIGNENNIVFYTDEEGNTKVEVVLQNEDVWLNVNAIAKLFDVQRPAITKHINNIYNENELEEESTCSKMEHMGNSGKQLYETKYYNLDMIISIGFRVNSKKAIKFRTWANKLIKEYIIKGFTLDDNRFLKGGKVNAKYFDELLERIKTIRTSERMAYQKITDLFIATAVDYNPNSEEAYTFFKIVQNKLHYAISGHTAAELIYNRVDSNKEHMGLTNWKNSPDGLIYKYDVTIAKNYLNEEELKKLNDLTNFFIVFAEDEAKERHVMTMQNWIDATDDLLKFRRKKVLDNAGSISHKEAIEKAENEYEKFKIKQDTQYISSMDEMYQKYLNESNNK
ncbi:MAG: cell filamentation protein Fic [Clostridia bacterium]|nr:cell filamentation protein Fic [Clostridia bacterium]